MQKIPKDIQDLFSKKQKVSKKQRSYVANKAIPFPKSISKRPSKASSQKYTLETKHCSIHQSYSFFTAYYGKSLKKRKIINRNAREKLIAMQKMNALTYEMQKWIHKELHHRVSTKEQSIELYDLLQKREERHFQIDRVIRYLST